MGVLSKNYIYKKLYFLGKLAISLMLIFILYKYNLIEAVLLKSLIEHFDLVIFGLLCLFVGILIGGMRWKLLIEAAGIQLPWKLVFQLYLIGSFFSCFLPGAAGGDAMRALYIYRVLDSGRSIAFLTLFTDRVFSLFGLLSAAAVIYIFSPIAPTDNSILFMYGRLTFFLLGGATLLVILGLLFASFVQKREWDKRLPSQIARYVSPMFAISLLYKKKWLILLYCLFLSMIASIISVLAILEFSLLFSFKLSPVVSLIAGIYANLSSAIPLTPGGVGVGEVVFAKVCADLSGIIAPFSTIYFIFRIGVMIVNLPGFLVYLLFDLSSYSSKNSCSSGRLA